MLPQATVLIILLPVFGAGSADSWQVPLASPAALVRPYLQPSSDYSAGHRGVDYRVSLAQPVFATTSGEISFAGKLVNRSLVAIKHGASLISEVEPVCTSLRVGDSVVAGQLIGSVCQPDSSYTHCPTVRCLHFSVRSNGKYLSPLTFIGWLNPSRLFPYALG